MRYHRRMEYSTWYERVSRPFRSEGSTRVFKLLDRALVAGFVIAYVALLAWLAATGDARLARAVLVPAATFMLANGLRMALDKPRPYETHDIQPLLVKDTRGQSFPSRHMASATVITCTLAWILPPLAVIGALGCAGIAFVRIVGGVHYPRDIVAAFALGIICAFIGFVGLPAV